MSRPVITDLKLGVTDFLPKKGQLDGSKFVDVFRVSFSVMVPMTDDKACRKYKIRVKIMDDDDTSGDDTLAISPFGPNPCYVFGPGRYNFFIGNTPESRNLPQNHKDAVSTFAGLPKDNPLPFGDYRLPNWSPIELNGDPGGEYEVYVQVSLIPC